MNTKKALAMFAASTIGMVIFAVLYFSTPAKTLTQTDTQLVTNVVVKEVEKAVSIPANIPAEYIVAMNLYQKMTNATMVANDKVLFNLKNVRVVCVIDDSIKEVASEDEIKAKFELTLRRNNVPISTDSQSVVYLNISGFFDKTGTYANNLLCYSINCVMSESQWVFRESECHYSLVNTYEEAGYYGYVGRTLANATLLDQVEKRAEIFANDYLSTNPKN
jgi:hypothetical protein